jgi:hypothetical protein
MRPSVRRDGLVVRDLPDETLVYDRRRHEAHCLNRTAAAVFHAADGTRSVEEIAASLDAGDPAARQAAVRLALRELERAGLIDIAPAEGPTRRELLRRIGMGAAFLLPAVVSVLAPTPAEAVVTCVTDCTGNQGKACNSPPLPCTGLDTCTCNTKGCCSDDGGA